MNKSKTSLKTTVEWNTINWAKVQRKVFKLQTKIFHAVKSGDKVKARKLQKLLEKSYFAKLLAVRKVTQDNMGKKTAGVDKVKSLDYKQRLILANSLTITGYKTKPLRRVWIPKPGKDEKRPLGIPTIKDRAMQCLVKFCMEPYWEAQFEGKSYGFRPGRSCHDAVEAIYSVIRLQSKYVLDADITKCFDKIDHDYLLNKLDNPHFRPIIRQWLKAGVMDENNLSDTDSGTPQGGVISPLLANIALHGMIDYVEQSFPKTKSRKVNGKAKVTYNPKVIRYADDFVIVHEELETIHHCQLLVNKWLEKVGLELRPEKTRICHTLNDTEIDGKTEKAGFNFLGFNIRQYPVGEHHSGKGAGGAHLLGFKTIIKPSKEAIKKHHQAMREVIDRNSHSPQGVLIRELKPVINGWAKYYSTVCSKAAFSKEDEVVWEMLRAWVLQRSKKGKRKALAKYYSPGMNGTWTFQTRGENNIVLPLHGHTEIVRHSSVKAEASPYDGNWAYWSKRRGTYPLTPKRVSLLLKKQKGKCPYCSQHFTPEDLIEIDHIIPTSQGGKDEFKNYQALHKHCHHKKHAKRKAS